MTNDRFATARRLARLSIYRPSLSVRDVRVAALPAYRRDPAGAARLRRAGCAGEARPCAARRARRRGVGADRHLSCRGRISLVAGPYRVHLDRKRPWRQRRRHAQAHPRRADRALRRAAMDLVPRLAGRLQRDLLAARRGCRTDPAGQGAAGVSGWKPGDRRPASGAITAAIGPEAAMACTAAVETEIDKHYSDQLQALGDSDPELSAAVADFQAEEVEHREPALAAGAENAPVYPLLSGLIRLGCKVAIATAKRI